jgi:oligopeptide/dipeptide ABC transporter ATP-binding protein
MNAPLLRVRDLVTRFSGVPVVDRISFDLAAGETLGIVGESGSGKSITALSIMRLVDAPGAVSAAELSFEGEDLLAKSEAQMRRIRGERISMIFQEPMTSLNPLFTVGDQIGETLRHHQGLDRASARAKAIELLKRVEIPSAERRADDYPHRLSGGMRQRVMIAMALACRPKILIADEPTTALDVTIQAQILDLLRMLQREFGMAVILITHDLGVVAEFVRRVIVMYAGRIAEQGPVDPLFASPQHPYTEGLLASIPDLDRSVERLAAIPGAIPSPRELPPGCRFHPRCGYARDPCAQAEPPLIAVGPERTAACIRHVDYRVGTAS